MADNTATITPFAHPGAGRRHAKSTPKGRHVTDAARADVEALLQDAPRERQFLIEYLHLIQDRHHQLSTAHLAALAETLRLSFAEVFETATFYAHFDIVRDHEPSLPPLTIRVCDGVTCAMFGAESLHATLARQMAAQGHEVRIVRAPCIGQCDAAPAVEVGHHIIPDATPDSVQAAIAAGQTHAQIPDHSIRLDAYLAAGGYRTFDRLRAGDLTSDHILAALDDATLRGLGGAGFPTGRKWRAVRNEPAPRLMAVNADEGEPGTFKDRHYLEHDPHRFLEGMLIGAHIVDAADIYIYLRDEYPGARALLQQEIARLSAARPGLPTIHLRRGAGAYICGEETAMLESIEGKRGLPRQKPPLPHQVGLFGRPTLINNVETLWWVRDLVERGADWWTSHGRNGRNGLRSFSVSGRVKNPGVKLAPAGITLRELIEEHCGGMADGHTLQGYLPGGASGGILPAHMDDVPLDFGTLERHGCFIGSAAIVVFSQHDHIPSMALNLMRFFEDESCGQCTPCRTGTHKARLLMQRPAWDSAVLNDLATVMRDASICGLGQAASNPLACVLRYFPETLQAEAAE